MNEISRPAEADTSGMSQVDLRSYLDKNTKMRESLDISKIAPALVRALGAIKNPSPNRSVQVRTQAGSYSFKYATLDTILDGARGVLLDNGLCVLQPIVATERGPALVTRLLHESGQWMECEIPLPPLGTNPQAFGSAVSYVRRYSISAMLNITADEDDDGNRAAGNHYQDTQDRGQKRRASQDERGGREPEDISDQMPMAVARALVNRARLAEGAEEGHAVLEAWLQRAQVLERLRGTKVWDLLELERELGAGLKRSLGVEPAAAFVAALRATEPAHVTALQSHWEGKWAESLGAMQREAPATYAMLRRHVAAQIARVRAAHGGNDAEADGGGEPEEPAFRATVKDDDGNPATDPFTDPVHFARAYAGIWAGTPPERLNTLARHNVKALGQAATNAEARRILDGLHETMAGAAKAQEEQRSGLAEHQGDGGASPPADEKPPTRIRMVSAAGDTGAVEGDKTTPVHQRWIGRWKREVDLLDTPEKARYWLKTNMALQGGMSVVERHWPDVYEAAGMHYQQRLDYLERTAGGEPAPKQGATGK